nr:eukaryotic translation initiation factor 3 subunit 8, N-terminal [Tanacetum cinerariifolium]
MTSRLWRIQDDDEDDSDVDEEQETATLTEALERYGHKNNASSNSKATKEKLKKKKKKDKLHGDDAVNNNVSESIEDQDKKPMMNKNKKDITKDNQFKDPTWDIVNKKLKEIVCCSW